MPIDVNDQVPNMNEESLPILQKIIGDISEQSEGTLYVDSEPSASNVPYGKKVIYDNGSGTKRIYWKTGRGNLGYITLT